MQKKTDCPGALTLGDLRSEKVAVLPDRTVLLLDTPAGLRPLTTGELGKVRLREGRRTVDGVVMAMSDEDSALLFTATSDMVTH